MRRMPSESSRASPATDYMLEFYLVSVPSEHRPRRESKPLTRWQAFWRIRRTATAESLT